MVSTHASVATLILPSEFFAAIVADDVALVRQALGADPGLLNAFADPAWAPRRWNRLTPLHCAIRSGAEAVGHLLLDAGADQTVRSTQGRTPLHDALEFRSPLAERLLQMTTDLDVVCTAYLGEMARLRALLDADPELLNDRTTELSPLCWAAYGDQVEAATELLARGARMSHHELFCAAACGHARVARVLLAHGADPNERDERGATALMIAAAIPYTRDTTELVRVLLEAGADVHARTPRGASALTVAVLGGARQASERVPPLERKQYELVADLLKAYGGKA